MPNISTSTVAPLLYSLEVTCPVAWAEAAGTQLHSGYPFLNRDDTDQDFVIRRYLETLWLPESFNPVSNLIPSLRRISSSSGRSSSQPHALHTLLQPLLLSTRVASDKYRTELVQILATGGGAGEQEEMMMWYSWEYEKAENEEEGVINEEKWRKTWLDRLERRETMIQILLNMLKLSLPGPKPQAEDKKSKKRKKKSVKHELLPETEEERLESYMDKITVWQLTSSLDGHQPSSQGGTKADRHWTQTFFEDVVEPLFKSDLPEQCTLFRSKLFPESPFSDVEESDAETLLNGRASRACSRAPSVSRGPLMRVPSIALSAAPSMQRSRSRSLSVSLAQDEASQRASFVAPKQVLSREFSMSRVFKEKPKAQAKFKPPREGQKTEREMPKMRRDVGTTLVEETPVKRRQPNSVGNEQGSWSSWCRQSQMHFVVPSPPPTSSSDPADMCIEDTPIAMRRRQAEDGSRFEEMLSPSSPLPDDTPGPPAKAAVKNTRIQGKKAVSSLSSRTTSRTTRSSGRARLNNDIDLDLDENTDDIYMDAFKSSNVMMLSRHGSPATLDCEDVEMATPTKRRNRIK